MFDKMLIKFFSGCQQRAYLFAKYLTEYLKEMYPGKKFDPPKKHFIFGRLIFETENAENGRDVEWQFHVTPAVKIRSLKPLLILDPSISPVPLTKQKYHQMFRDQGILSGYVTCEADTYGWLDSCINPNNMDDPVKQEAAYLLNGDILNK